MSYKRKKLPKIISAKNLVSIMQVPEAELDIKMKEINRKQAKFKEQMRIQECKIWQELYEGHKIKETSLASKHNLDDILTNSRLCLPKIYPGEKHSTVQDELPQYEAYKDFITFKARIMAKFVRNPHQVKRPNYMETNYMKYYRKQENTKNYLKIVDKYEKIQRKRQVIEDTLNIEE